MRGEVALVAVVGAGAAALALVSAWRKKSKKKKNLEDLIRPNIRVLAPYRCARDDYSSGTLLDANENAFGSAVSTEEFDELHRYPDPTASEVREGISRLRGVPADNVFVGVGSDEAIDVLFRVFCEPGKSSVLILPPTYGMYKVCAAVNDVKVLSAPLDDDFDVDVEACASAARSDTRLVFVTSPGNPTSRLVSNSRVVELLRRIPDAIVVLDEAYVDCCGADRATASPLVLQHPRLVVLHTLSKAFGLAGVRVGTAIASVEIVSYMNRLKAPYNVNKMTAKVAATALQEKGLETMRRNVEALIEQRQYLVEQLTKAPYIEKVFHSDANFLLAKVTPSSLAYPLYKALADKANVVVRYRGDQLNCDGCIRITVGTPQENKQLLSALDKVVPTLA